MDSSTLLQDEHDHDEFGEIFFVSLTDDDAGSAQSPAGPYRDSRPIL